MKREPSGNCAHAAFACNAAIKRLTDTEGGPVTGYAVDVRITCDDCGEAFTWLGVPGGVSPHHPTVSVDGQELRAPLAPASHKQAPLDRLAGDLVHE